MRGILPISMIISVLVLMGVAIVIPAQNVTQSRQVNFPKTSLAECFTATWCTYCPGAEGALDKLANEMSLNELAIIEYHDQDSYSSVDSLCDDRLNFYSVPGIPETFFSGENAALGGSTNPNDQQIYNWYKTKIDNDLGNATGVVLSMDTKVNGTFLYVTVNVTSSYPPQDDNLYLEVMLVYDENITDGLYHIRYSAVKWIGETQITLGTGSVVTKSYTTTLSSSWEKSKLYVVAFVQTHNTQQISEGGYNWKEAKVYNAVIQPVEKWELKPMESEIVTSENTMYELKTTVSNELSIDKNITVGYDPTTVPNGWTVKIFINNTEYNSNEVNFTLQPGETKTVYYHITPSDAQIAYIKIYAYGDQKYSDAHYIKVNSSGIPEINIGALMIVAIPVILRKNW